MCVKTQPGVLIYVFASKPKCQNGNNLRFSQILFFNRMNCKDFVVVVVVVIGYHCLPDKTR